MIVFKHSGIYPSIGFFSMTCFFKEIRFSKYPACRTILQIVFAGRSEQFAKLFYTCLQNNSANYFCRPFRTICKIVLHLPAEQFCKLFLNLQNCFTPCLQNNSANYFCRPFRTICKIVLHLPAEQFCKLFLTICKIVLHLPAEQFCKIVLHPACRTILQNCFTPYSKV